MSASLATLASSAEKCGRAADAAGGADAPPGRILIVDDHREARQSMADVLRRAGHRVDCLSSAVEGLRALDSEGPDVVITDLRMPGMSGLDFIQELESRRHGAQIIMVTAHATVASAVEAMRRGAFDYIEKPFGADQLESLVARALCHGRMLDQRQQLSGDAGPAAMIGDSPAMRALRTRIAQVAATSETVLITGESGVGKELVARAIHAGSGRAQASLVSLNCPVLSAHLMESELFGHQRGAYTGADVARTGRFELADGGTILLDEVTEIDPALQAKLLRVLQEKSFERVGSSLTIQVDVRVLASTNRDLRREVEAGHFRQDLYYRLAVLPIYVPPLRERREDIGLLFDHFLDRAARRLNRECCRLDASARELVEGYHWPGNVRELENIAARASVLHAADVIGADELRPWLLDPSGDQRTASQTALPVGLNLQDMERQLIEATLQRFSGHRASTAKALGIGIRTLSGKLRAYGYAPRANAPARAG